MPIILVPPDATEPLVSLEDVECRMGRTLTATEEDRLACLIADASAAVRAYTGQHFSVATTTARIKVKGGVIRLPQRPVTAVSALANTTGTALLFTWDAGAQVWLSSSLPLANGPTCSGRLPQYVDVTYTHGYDTIPADVVAVVAQMAGRALGTTPAEGGVQSESIGGYNYSLGSAAAAGGIGMLPAERAVLDRYKTPAGPIAMTGGLLVRR